MEYKCYLGGELMPETPSKLSLSIKGQSSTVSLLNGGEISFLKAAALTDITLPLTFPMLTGVKRPEYYIGLLEKLKSEKKATQLIVTRTAPSGELLFDTNTKVSVEDYSISENAKNGLDISAEVKLKQYRDYGTKTIAVSNGEVRVSTSRASDTSPKALSHTVKEGESLWSIAKLYSGSGAKYMKIFNANKDKLKSPNLIYVGQALTIPDDL